MAGETDANLDREWSFAINLSGISAPTGAQKMELPEGYYKAVLTDAYVNSERNRGRVIFKLAIAEGPFKGLIRTDGLNIPRDANDKVRYFWRGLAESAGYTPAQLDAGEITLSVDTFKGRTVHIRYAPKTDEQEYDQVNYLPPSEWTQQRQIFEAGTRSDAPAEAGSALGGAGEKGLKPEPTPTKSKADVLGALGLQ